MTIKIKRAYEPAVEEDGQRILVERLWPRGLSKARAQLSLWLKEIAPSTQLRRWFGHDPERWQEFRARYKAELDKVKHHLDDLKERARKGPITLLYSAHDGERNSAAVVKERLEE